MKTAPKTAARRADINGFAQRAVFWLTLCLLVAVPLIFSSAVRRIFSLPKFAILIVGSSALATLICLIAATPARSKILGPLKSKHVLIACLYLVAVAISTVFGVAPMVNLFGSFENQMGLIARLCFLVCFLGLIAGIGHSQTRLRQTVWVMSVTGMVAATYAFLQFFGHDRLLDSALYTFNSAEGPIVRVIGTLGHANYLGNFLLYTIPLSVALLIVAQGSARGFALIAIAVSIAAIIFSGTRGAALGLIAGIVTFLTFEFRAARKLFNRRSVLSAAAIFAIIIASIFAISLNPASRSIVARAITAIKEGASGSGRTLLWRDSIKMVPAFALTGCGPEGFRKAFLAYKSKEIAQLAPDINDESSHNSYLDAAISYGLPGAIFYAALIASSFALLIRARRRAVNQETKIIITGLIAALAGVATHNFFIFDQLPTGLYFFALAALAEVALKVAKAEQPDETARAQSGAAHVKAEDAAPPAFWFRLTSGAVAAVGLAVTAMALWYSIALAKADVAINKSFQAADTGDYESALAHGQRATSSPDMTGSYNFQFARALALYADKMQYAVNSFGVTGNELARMKAARADALRLAKTQAERSLARTLTPDSSYMLMAYLALVSGDSAGLRTNINEAVKWDKYYSSGRWLMAEAYLVEGDRERAEIEAKFALELNPNLREAQITLKRAQGRKDMHQQTIEELLASAREFREKGMSKKELKRLLLAVKKSRGQCPDCHRALALVYEDQNLNEKAMDEWRIFIEQSQDRNTIKEAQSRIESLKQRASANQ